MKLTDEITGPLTRAERALAQRARLLEAIEETEQRLPIAEAEQAAAFAGLGEAEVRRATPDLAGENVPSPATIAKLRTSLGNARDAVDSLKARRAGLDIALKMHDDEIRAASEQLRVAREEYIQRAIAEYETQFNAAARRFAAEVAKAKAIARTLDVTFLGLTNLEVYQLRENRGDLISEASVAVPEEAEAARIRNAAKNLERECERIGRAEHAEAQKAAQEAAKALPKGATSEVSNEHWAMRLTAYSDGYGPRW